MTIQEELERRRGHLLAELADIDNTLGGARQAATQAAKSAADTAWERDARRRIAAAAALLDRCYRHAETRTAARLTPIRAKGAA